MKADAEILHNLSGVFKQTKDLWICETNHALVRLLDLYCPMKGNLFLQAFMSRRYFKVKGARFRNQCWVLVQLLSCSLFLIKIPESKTTSPGCKKQFKC